MINPSKKTKITNNGKRKSRPKIEIIFYTKLNELGIPTLEEPKMQNRVKRADEWLRDSMYVLDSIVDIFSNIVLTISTAFILYIYIPAMLPLLVIYSVIRFLPNRYFSKLAFNLQAKGYQSEKALGDVSNMLE